MRSPESDREVLEERARLLARPEEAAAADMLEVVGFRLAGERYGIDADAVINLCDLTGLTPLPSGLEAVIGITEWRGELLTVLDLRRLLGLRADGLNDLGMLLVLGGDRPEFAVLADAVDRLMAIDASKLHDTRRDDATGAGFVRGVTEDAVVLLNAESLLRAWRARRD